MKTRESGHGPSYAPAKKSLGQNFLQDKNVAAKIVAALSLGPKDNLLEIGPGRGALLEPIFAAAPARYLAIEKDRDLAQILRETRLGAEIICADALDFAWESLAGLSPLKFVGNLPYNIASPLIWELVSRAPSFERAVFMIQHEVALRITADPGSRAYGGLSVWLNNFVQCEYLFKVGPGVFFPKPKVDSAVIALKPRPEKPVPGQDIEAFKALIKLCFNQRRKQIRNILRAYWDDGLAGLLLEQGHAASARPEELSCAPFAKMAGYLKNSLPGLTSR